MVRGQRAMERVKGELKMRTDRFENERRRQTLRERERERERERSRQSDRQTKTETGRQTEGKRLR